MSVRVLSRWDGFCLACLTDRPLVLTLTGPGGVKAWWNGVGWHDRDLALTCQLCGRVEPVTWDEADDPEVDLLYVEQLAVVGPAVETAETQPEPASDPLFGAVAPQPVLLATEPVGAVPVSGPAPEGPVAAWPTDHEVSLPVTLPWDLPVELAVDVPVSEPHHPIVQPVPVVLPVAGAGGIASVPILVALPLETVVRVTPVEPVPDAALGAVPEPVEPAPVEPAIVELAPVEPVIVEAAPVEPAVVAEPSPVQEPSRPAEVPAQRVAGVSPRPSSTKVPRQKTMSTQENKQEAARQRVARQQSRRVEAS